MEFIQCTNLYPIHRSNKGTLNNKSYFADDNHIHHTNKHSSTLFLGYLMC